MQPYQTARKTGLFPRLVAMKLLGGNCPTYHGYHLFLLASLGGISSFASTFMGMAKRVLNINTRAPI